MAAFGTATLVAVALACRYRIRSTGHASWRNVQRDSDNSRLLRKAGWRVIVIWECETKDAQKLAGILRRKFAFKLPKPPPVRI